MRKNDDKRKTVHTVLDELPYGDGVPEYENAQIRKVKLPAGVKRSSLMRDVILIAWPSLLELILTQLTSMVDQMMVGRLPGQEGIAALSAVGLATQPKFLLFTMIIALNTGSTAVIARYRGQQNQFKANQTFFQALLLNVLMSGAFMVLGLVFAEPLIRFMGAGGITQETLAMAVDYLRIQLYGFIPVCLTSTVTAALRGVGDTRTPLAYNVIANLVNVVGNYLLIYGKFGCPRMGVAGASLATVIGQCVAFVIAVWVVMSGKRYMHLNFKEKFSFDKGTMKDVVVIGVPSMVEQLFMRAGAIIYVRTVAGLGDVMYATHNVLMSILSMSFMMGQAFATSVTTMMGQSLGKRRSDMAALYMRECRRLGLYAACVLMVLMGLFRHQLIAMYNDTPEVVQMGGQIMLLMAVMQPLQSDQFIVSGGLRGAGDTKYTAIAVAITVLGVRNILGIFTVNVLDWGLWGAWIAMCADQVIRTVLMLYRYYSGKWRNIVLAARN